MCELCDDDVVSLATDRAARTQVMDDPPPSLSVLSEEITAQIGDIERHLDTERSDNVRYSLCQAMWGLKWSRECLLGIIDPTHEWTSFPTWGELLARYPHPDQQPK